MQKDNSHSLKGKGLLALVLALVGAVAAVPASAQAPGEASAVYPTDCDRACLIGHARDYMKALVAHDPARLKFTPDAQFTENNVVMRIGQGLWGTISDASADAMEAADPQTGNVAWFGYVREHGEPAIYAMRLKLVAGRIAEVETVVHRKGGLPAPFGDVAKMAHDPEFQAVLPPEQRRSRERLIAVAQSYFNTVERNDGQVFAPFSDDCGRLENGISTTSGGTAGNAGSIVQGCEAQFKLGIYRINKRVRERRFPLVDEERGIVVATGFFDHDNSFDHYLLTNGHEMKTALKWPNSISLLEAFRIKDGKISRIEADFTYVPYFRHNPWDTSKPILGAPAETAPLANPEPVCDKLCLTRLAGQYMEALVAKDPSKADWAKTGRFSENSVPLMIGDGLWGSVTGAGKNPLVVADPQSGNVAWVGTVEEHGQPAFYAMRLHAEGKRIATVETIIRRKEGHPPYGDAATYVRDAAFEARTPKDARVSRDRIAALVTGYFNSVAHSDGTVLTKFAGDCARTMNGVSLTTPEMGCEKQIGAALFRQVDDIRGRELVAIDEERGLAVAFGFRDQSARVQAYTTTDGKPFAAETKYPLSYNIAWVFKIDANGIRRIDETATELNYLSPSPWEY